MQCLEDVSDAQSYTGDAQLDFTLFVDKESHTRTKRGKVHQGWEGDDTVALGIADGATVRLARRSI